ncbi:MAG: hypothetical protein WKF92_06710 [Pyrinomonadaceae bacterium]
MSVTGKVIKHSVIAVRDAFGNVRYGDYGGKLVAACKNLQNGLGTAFRTLRELV